MVPRPTLYRAKAFPGWPRTWPLVDGKVARKWLADLGSVPARLPARLPTYLGWAGTEHPPYVLPSLTEQALSRAIPSRLPDARPKCCKFRDRCLSAASAFPNRDAHFLAPSTRWVSTPFPLLFLPGISRPLPYILAPHFKLFQCVTLFSSTAQLCLPCQSVLTTSTKTSPKHPHWSTSTTSSYPCELKSS